MCGGFPGARGCPANRLLAAGVWLTRLAWRFAATGGILMVDPVVTPIPVVGELVDVVTLVFLVYYWYTFFRQALNPPRHPPSAPSGHGPTVIERDRPPLMRRIRR